MTKAEIVAGISEETGLERSEALRAVEAFMLSIKRSLSEGQNVYLRGFGSFVVKRRAQKTGRNISKKTTVIIPAHNCLLYTSPSPRDLSTSRMPSSA